MSLTSSQPLPSAVALDPATAAFANTAITFAIAVAVLPLPSPHVTMDHRQLPPHFCHPLCRHFLLFDC
jgi:hypothetical protein